MTNMSGAWYPTIFPEKCDGCAKYGAPKCIEYCPNGVFALGEGKAVVANPHKCVNGCTACEPLCHKKAISFPKRASTFTSVTLKSKDLLRKTVCVKCGKEFWTNRESDICMDCEKFP